VTLEPTRPWDIGGDRYLIAVTGSYTVDGDAHPHMLNARALVEAQVAGAIYEMGLAASLLPLCCFAAAIRRWWSTR
jgi:hypothetical protein